MRKPLPGRRLAGPYQKPIAHPPPQAPVAPAPPRLPHGAIIECTYSAHTQAWQGSLCIPGMLPFVADARTLFTLCKRLDALYRKYLKEKPCSTEPTKTAPLT